MHQQGINQVKQMQENGGILQTGKGGQIRGAWSELLTQKRGNSLMQSRVCCLQLNTVSFTAVCSLSYSTHACSILDRQALTKLFTKINPVGMS